MKDRFSIKDKNILILGGTGKIGMPIALECSAAGANVFVASRSKKISKPISKKFKELNIEYIQMDASNEDQVKLCVNKITSKVGDIDTLINSISFRPMQKFMDDTPRNWKNSIVENSLAAFLPARLIGKRMAQLKSGSIIQFSSIYGIVSPPMSLYEDCTFETEPDYPFIKSGIIGLSKFLSSYFAKSGVRVNVIAPGGVYNNQEEAFLKKYNSFNPMGRMANTDDLIGLVIFLASDASKYITGTVIPVDGGWTAV